MFAVTERLLLRPGWAEDAPALARALDDNRIVRNLSGPPWPYRLSDAEQFLASPADPLRPRFLVVIRATGMLIGGIGLDGAEPALGYWLTPAHWGCGYATEAARAVVELADRSLRLPRLVSAHALDNPASANVLRKIGFVPGGLSAQHSPGRGGLMQVRRLARERPTDTPAVPLAA